MRYIQEIEEIGKALPFGLHDYISSARVQFLYHDNDMAAMPLLTARGQRTSFDTKRVNIDDMPGLKHAYWLTRGIAAPPPPPCTGSAIAISASSYSQLFNV